MSEKIPRMECNPRETLEEKIKFLEKNRAGDIPILLFAAKVGDEEVCEYLVQAGHYGGVTEAKSGANVFHFAAENAVHGLQLIEIFLVSHGADAQKKNYEETDAVTHAFRNKNIYFAMKLFKFYEYPGSLLLHCICEGLELLKFAFEKDNSVVKKKGSDRFDEKLLIEAAMYTDLPTLQWFLSICGEELAKDDGWKLDAVLKATRNKRHGRRITRYLLKSFRFTLTTENLALLLGESLIQGNIKMATTLLDHGADIKLVADEQAPLHFCVVENSLAGARFVHEKDRTQMDLMTEDGETTLHLAAEFSSVRMCEWLIKEGQDLSAINPKMESTFLHCAAYNHDQGGKIIRHFGQRLREDLNRRDKLEETPLHKALKSRNLKAAEALIEMGADLDVKLKMCNLLLYCLGNNVLSSAKFIYAKDAKQIEGLGKNKETGLHIAEEYQNYHMLEWLLNV
ncbi:uncharacterized protein LOC135943752 [Cloeon dipterum]|uniref:uncharacterized protein LOC135943752 n=1 Tax=Cloeon dipterum TaxID=197152 RepID=UPI00321F9BE2